MSKLFIFAFMVTVSSMSFAQNTPKTGAGQDCGEIANKIRPEADKCIALKNHAKRTKCFDDVGNKFGLNGSNSCGPQLEPVKQEYMAKEKQLYPKQASALNGNDGGKGGNNNGGPGGNNGPGNMQGGNNNGGPGGNNGPGNMQGGNNNGGPGGNNGPGNMQGGNNGSAPAVSEADCKKEVPKVTKNADACMKNKDANKRHACFDKIGTGYPPQYLDQSCRSTFEPLKNQYMTQEKQLYPNQPSALGGGNNNGGPGGNNGPGNMQGGNNNGGPGGNDGPGNMQGGNGKAVDCGKATEKAKSGADKCLKVANQPKRKACFDKIGDKLQKKGAMEACGDALEKLKQEILKQESASYPKDPPSIN